MTQSNAGPTGDLEVAGSIPTGSGNTFYVEIDHVIFSTVILSLPPIQEGHLSVSGERIFTNIGIKHDFSCINIRQVPWEVLKTEAGGRGFQYLPRDLANNNTLKNHVQPLLLHKN